MADLELAMNLTLKLIKILFLPKCSRVRMILTSQDFFLCVYLNMHNLGQDSQLILIFHKFSICKFAYLSKLQTLQMNTYIFTLIHRHFVVLSLHSV